MANLFQKARGWLHTTALRAAGVTVTYARGASSLTVSAIVGRTVFSSNALDGPRIEFGDRDYLIQATDLTIGEPAIGDRITEIIDGVTRVFEVLTPGTGEPAWRWSDPAHTVYRIHCKRVS